MSQSRQVTKRNTCTPQPQRAPRPAVHFATVYTPSSIASQVIQPEIPTHTHRKGVSPPCGQATLSGRPEPVMHP
ncbi:hypothetical protein LshimejAT787_0309200 [Lyophyllum shimeji]|uniref:Uncharacterized protein n=1 Tax=Lyophyllum shimeji TaxID=47721 RepID=A0A9P3PJT3_LYOSH|nr:hypothetical protein LshimejAT787_0309200 [Lyophyllum shimeji]